jgi:hypothetical protein
VLSRLQFALWLEQKKSSGAAPGTTNWPGRLIFNSACSLLSIGCHRCGKSDKTARLNPGDENAYIHIIVSLTTCNWLMSTRPTYFAISLFFSAASMQIQMWYTVCAKRCRSTAVIWGLLAPIARSAKSTIEHTRRALQRRSGMSVGWPPSGSVHSAGQRRARDKLQLMKWLTAGLHSKQKLRWVETTFVYQYRLANESWG